MRGASNDARLRVQDIEEALREAGNRPPKRVSQIAAEEHEEEEEEEEDVEEDQSELVPKQRRTWGCGCRDEGTAITAQSAVGDFKGRDLAGKVSLLEAFDGGAWERTCYRHIKSIASGLELQTTRLNCSRVVERLLFIQGNKHRLDKIVREQGTCEWFRLTGRPEHEDDRLGTL